MMRWRNRAAGMTCPASCQSKANEYRRAREVRTAGSGRLSAVEKLAWFHKTASVARGVRCALRFMAFWGTGHRVSGGARGR